MNKNIPVIALAVGVLLFSALGLFMLSNLSSSSQSQDNHLQQALDTQSPLSVISQLQTLDAAWSISALKTLNTPNSDFDDVASYLPKVRENKTALLNSDLAKNETPMSLKTQMQRLISLVEVKEEAIERFKSQFAAMRNSQHYLPLAVEAVVNSDKRGKYKTLQAEIRSFHTQISQFMRFPNEGDKNRLFETLRKLETQSMQLPTELSNSLNNFASHARVILERRIPLDEAVEILIQNRVQQAGDELSSQYRQELISQENTRLSQHQQAQKQTHLLAMIALILLALSAFAGVFLAWRSQHRLLAQEHQITQHEEDLLEKETRLHEMEQSMQERIKDALAQHSTKLQGVMDTQTQTQIDSSETSTLLTLSRMAASLAHEVNTPLGYVSSNIEILEGSYEQIHHLFEEIDLLKGDLKTTEGGEEIEHHLDRLEMLLTQTRNDAMLDEIPSILKDMTSGVDQIKHLIKDLREFGRVDRAEQALFNLNETLKNSLRMLIPRYKEQINVATNLETIPEFYGSPGQMTQVFTNLINNAAQAVLQSEKEPKKISILSKPHGGFIVINIVDNGVGIPEEDSKKIFEPFYTTKSSTEGSGLGLAIVSRIINRHGGKVRLKSVLGTGTNIQIVLPASNA